jgi:hypothetical protein
VRHEALLAGYGELFSQSEGNASGEPTTQAVLFQCPSKYSLLDTKEQQVAAGDALTRLDQENLSVLPKLAAPLSLAYRDIIDASPSDFALKLALSSGETLTLFSLGYKYEDFVRVFSKLRNEILLKDALMNESLRKSGIAATLVHLGEGGKEVSTGKCQLRLYDTAVVLIPEKGEFTRIPYSCVTNAHDEGYSLRLTAESGDQFVLSGMGKDFESVKETLSTVMSELSLRAQVLLKELLPDASPAVIWKAASFMKDGRAASRFEIESVSQELWAGLEKRLEVLGMREEYDFLKAMSRQQKICIGMKRGLMGDLTGDYVWFLVPIYGGPPGETGNAIAMEASTGESPGRATYFFKIVNRSDYRLTKNTQILDETVDALLREIDRCMLEINFRREPIYLPDTKLDDPQYLRYRFAVKKLKRLRTLRNLYVGRVMHFSPDQWRKDVMDLLSFNASAVDENAKWLKTGAELSAEEG